MSLKTVARTALTATTVAVAILATPAAASASGRACSSYKYLSTLSFRVCVDVYDSDRGAMYATYSIEMYNGGASNVNFSYSVKRKINGISYGCTSATGWNIEGGGWRTYKCDGDINLGSNQATYGDVTVGSWKTSATSPAVTVRSS